MTMGAHSSTLKRGVDWDELVLHHSRCSAVGVGMPRAKTDRLPAPYDMDFERHRYYQAEDMPAFLASAAKTLDEVEPWIREQHEKPWNEP
jgi:hypothetical protein